MKVIGIQMDIAWEDREANYRKVKELLAGISVSPGSLIVLPEMFSSGFSMNVKSVAETQENQTLSVLSSISQEHKSFVLGGLVTCSSVGMGRNQAAVTGPSGKEIARYTKLHPFSYAGESQFYAPGKQLVYFDVNHFKAAPFICYDLRFPEAFRVASRNGVTLFIVIANWPEARVSHWTALLQARAIENQGYVIGINRAGKDPNIRYPGSSLIIDPRGNILADGGREECVVEAELNLEELHHYRKTFPALKDIRKDFLSGTR